MEKKLIINATSLQKRMAIIEDNKLVEYHIEQPNNHEVVGNIYVGRVTDVHPGIQAAFVDYGADKKGFIHLNQLLSYHLSPSSVKEKHQTSISSFVHQGEIILVQGIKEEIGNKGAKLSGIIEIPGRYVIYLPFGNYVAVSKKIEDNVKRTFLQSLGEDWCEGNEGVIFRTACKEADEEVVIQELIFLKERFQQLQLRQQMTKPPYLLHHGNHFVDKIFREIPQSTIKEVIVDEQNYYKEIKTRLTGIKEETTPSVSLYTNKINIFSAFHLDHEIDKLLKKIVWLDNGGYIIIEQTEALTVIDVNSGKYLGKSAIRDTIVRINKLAAIEIARQLRLRDIGGIILIDFIDMKNEEDKRQVSHVLTKELRKDRTRTNVFGYTRLGILEMSRKKVRDSIPIQLTTSCEKCDGIGRVLSNEEIAYKLDREMMEYRQTDFEAIWIETTESIKKVFCGPNDEHLTRLETMLRLSIFLTTTSMKTEAFYEIKQMGTYADILEKVNKSKVENTY
ncbi:Rne/Rng family ribonuclease [Cytobacillus sp. Hm23]